MSTIGIIHTVFAVIALASGLAIFTISKGSQQHRIIGYIYVMSMLGLNITALTIYRLFGGFGPFHAFAIGSLIGLAGGFIPVFTKRPANTWLDNHYHGILWSYVGLVAAAAAEIITRVPAFHQSGIAFGLSVFVTTVVITTIGGFIIYRKKKTIVPHMLAMLANKANV